MAGVVMVQICKHSGVNPTKLINSYLSIDSSEPFLRSKQSDNILFAE